MKSEPFTFQCAHLIWLYRSTLSANRALSSAISAWRFDSGTPTLHLQEQRWSPGIESPSADRAAQCAVGRQRGSVQPNQVGALEREGFGFHSAARTV